jgi:hypothetical protein
VICPLSPPSGPLQKVGRLALVREWRGSQASDLALVMGRLQGWLGGAEGGAEGGWVRRKGAEEGCRRRVRTKGG